MGRGCGQHEVVGKVKNLFYNSLLKDFYFRHEPQTLPKKKGRTKAERNEIKL